MPSEPQDWSAEQWARWAYRFIGQSTEHDNTICSCQRHFNPLHDANHLFLVLDEIERRKLSWKWDYDMWFEDRRTTFQAAPLLARLHCPFGNDSRNLAVLLAAHALEEEKS